MSTETARYGAASMTGTLARVLVRAPLPEDATGWREAGWHAAPDVTEAQREHAALCAVARRRGRRGRRHGARRGEPGCDLRLRPGARRPGRRGAAATRKGRPARRARAIAVDLERAGVPIAHRLEPPATVEGGDTLWLDETTLLVGVGYRTNEAGVEALRDAFPGVDVLAFDLPHWTGSGEVMHLMSFISPVDRDLAVVYPRIAPVRLMTMLADRGISVVDVPDKEFATQGSNVLALGPRRALALAGNDETRRRHGSAPVSRSSRTRATRSRSRATAAELA